MISWIFRPLRFPSLPRFRNPFAVTKPLWYWIFWYAVALFLGSLIPVFFLVVQPSLHGKNGLRIGADSAIYLWYAGLDSDPSLLKTAYHVTEPYPDEIALISLSGNFAGPYVIATICRSDFLIMLFNYLLFFVAMHYLFKLSSVNKKMLIALMLINPITVVSIMTLNKEIIVLLAAALFAYYLEARSKILLLITLLVSVFARWEQAACVVIFLLLTSRLNPWRKRRWVTVLLVVLVISVLYPPLAATFRTFVSDNELSGGLMTAVNWLQEHYLFPLALVPKMVMNIFGTFISMFYAKRWDWSDLQNSFIGPIGATLLVVLMIALTYSKRLKLKKDLVYYSVLFMIVLSASPFLQPRYMYPMYVFACIELSRRIPTASLAN